MRRARTAVLAEREQAKAFDEWVAPKSPRKTKDGKPAKRALPGGPALIAKTIEEVTEIHTSKQWHRAQPKHFVGLYAWLHEQVYGVKPVELAKEWTFAVSAARAILKHEFGEDPSRFVQFMQWCWGKEKIAEKKRDASNTFRISWKYQFVGRALVSDYRVAMTRAGKR